MITAIIIVMRIKAIIIILVAVGIAQPLFLRCVFGLFSEQGFAILFGDLVIVRVDFAKSKEAVAVSPIINERRLKRRFNPRYFGKIDIALELFMLSGFEVKFLDPVSFGDGHTGFFPVAGVDQHPHCHLIVSVRAAVPEGRLRLRELVRARAARTSAV